MTRKGKPKRQYDNSQRQPSSIAGDCMACRRWLVEAIKPQKTRVYAQKGRIRYCRCDNCGNTWKVPVEVKST